MLKRKEEQDITQHEIKALKTRYNLADAHTHQQQSESQKLIVEALPDIWYQSEKRTQYQAEQEFIKYFYNLHGQQSALTRRDNIYLVYAASISMHITATYLMQKQYKVGLIEPCFDNLSDLIRHMRTPISPLDESLFTDSGTVYKNLQNHAQHLDAIILVDPNNPTGSCICSDSLDSFSEIVRYCKNYNKLLVLDFCFAAFILANGDKRPDVYETLESSEVSYIAMEDVGKTWPLQDTKCATILASKDVNDEIYSIVTSVLLNVSPFVLTLVSRYIRDSAKDNFASVRNLLATNREYTKKYLDGDILTYCEPKVKTSVAWFKINKPDLSADRLQEFLLGKHIYILSGKYFYWANPRLGQRYIRIALARDPAIFQKAMVVMKAAIYELSCQ